MKNHTQNVVEKLVLDYPWTNSFEFTKVCCCMSNLRFTKILVLSTYFYIFAFTKAKKVLEITSLPRFLDGFWAKIFLNLYCISWPNFITWFWIHQLNLKKILAVRTFVLPESFFFKQILLLRFRYGYREIRQFFYS